MASMDKDSWIAHLEFGKQKWQKARLLKQPYLKVSLAKMPFYYSKTPWLYVGCPSKSSEKKYITS